METLDQYVYELDPLVRCYNILVQYIIYVHQNYNR